MLGFVFTVACLLTCDLVFTLFYLCCLGYYLLDLCVDVAFRLFDLGYIGFITICLVLFNSICLFCILHVCYY